MNVTNEIWVQGAAYGNGFTAAPEYLAAVERAVLDPSGCWAWITEEDGVEHVVTARPSGVYVLVLADEDEGVVLSPEKALEHAWNVIVASDAVALGWVS